MPKEYVACKEALKKKGVSDKVAKARCAAIFYKRHGITVNEAHKRGWAIDLIDDNANELSVLFNTKLKDLDKKIRYKKGNTKSMEIISMNLDLLENFDIVEIIATKVGAKAYTGSGESLIWTEGALENSANTWFMTRVSANHEKVDHGRVLDSYFENPNLFMTLKVDAKMKKWIEVAKNMIGVSIEADSVEINDDLEIVEATGTGITFVFPPHEPACKIEEGCKIISTEEDEALNDIISEIILAAPKFIPPEAGTLPEEGKKILTKVYTKCRSTMFKEEKPEDKERCSKIAWNAVKRAGFHKEGSKWIKSVENTSVHETLFIPEEFTNILGYDEDLDCITLNGIPMDYSGITLHNNNEDEIETEETIEIAGTEEQTDIDTGDINMAEEQDEPTICVEEHKKLMTEKDAKIDELEKTIKSFTSEIEELTATVKTYLDAEKEELLKTLSEDGIDVEPHKDKDVETLKTVISAITSFKKKLDEEAEVNSGAVAASEKSGDEDTGHTVTEEMTGDTETDEAKTDKEITEATWKKAENYGLKKIESGE